MDTFAVTNRLYMRYRLLLESVLPHLLYSLELEDAYLGNILNIRLTTISKPKVVEDIAAALAIVIYSLKEALEYCNRYPDLYWIARLLKSGYLVSADYV